MLDTMATMTRQTGRTQARRILAELVRREDFGTTPPSLAELAVILGVTPGVAAVHMRRLVALGMVGRVPGKHRSWYTTPAGREYLVTDF